MSVNKSDEEWRRQLTPEQYAVCRCGATEPPFTGRYWNTKINGTYACACCSQPLFHARNKYDSGSGWPSFWQPIGDAAVSERVDVSHGMTRTETLCAGCGAHLGHVFPDGPPPSGLRYCINSAALVLMPED